MLLHPGCPVPQHPLHTPCILLHPSCAPGAPAGSPLPVLQPHAAPAPLCIPACACIPQHPSCTPVSLHVTWIRCTPSILHPFSSFHTPFTPPHLPLCTHPAPRLPHYILQHPSCIPLYPCKHLLFLASCSPSFFCRLPLSPPFIPSCTHPAHLCPLSPPARLIHPFIPLAPSCTPACAPQIPPHPCPPACPPQALRHPLCPRSVHPKHLSCSCDLLGPPVSPHPPDHWAPRHPPHPHHPTPSSLHPSAAQSLPHPLAPGTPAPPASPSHPVSLVRTPTRPLHPPTPGSPLLPLWHPPPAPHSLPDSCSSLSPFSVALCPSMSLMPCQPHGACVPMSPCVPCTTSPWSHPAPRGRALLPLALPLGGPGGSVPASPLPRGRGLWPRPGGRGQPLPRAQPCPHIPPCWGHERSDLVPVPKPGDRWIHRLGAGGGFGPCGHRGVAQAAGAASLWRGRARAGEGGRVTVAG